MNNAPGNPTPDTDEEADGPLRMPLTSPRTAPTSPEAARPRRRLGGLVRALCALPMAAFLALAAPAAAQSPFSAAVWVNDQAVTHHDIDQRARFLTVIGAGGVEPRARARERLIEERLQLQQARRFGLRITPEQMRAG
jgi:peptidyl-prolyl cis-trans isomerase SurA